MKVFDPKPGGNSIRDTYKMNKEKVKKNMESRQESAKERKAYKQQNQKERNPMNWIVTGVVGVCFLVAGGLVLGGNSVVGESNQKYQENMKTIQELKQSIAEISEQKTVTKQEMTVNLSSAREAGEVVANNQNKYKTIELNTSTNAGFDDLKKVTESIRRYIPDESKSSAWYAAVDKEVSYTWKFQSTYSFEGDTIPVLWVCRNDEDGTVLAYTTATYSVSKDVFTDVESNMTTIGLSYVTSEQKGVSDNLIEDVD